MGGVSKAQRCRPSPFLPSSPARPLRRGLAAEWKLILLWAGPEQLRPLLLLYERVLDLLLDAAYWVEVARDARRAGGGYTSGSPTTVKGSTIDLNPRLAAEDGLSMTSSVKVRGREICKPNRMPSYFSSVLPSRTCMGADMSH